ncbi:type 1 glutamine amidotransferase domain-containing protein [Planomonospora venezuelensis]|uniref:Putative intracellular protease/amidase n=1 Tax=Planomonospora venezuelensis TaxID=1999 RepID=A0A841D9B3_PLAVE|nr:type 1 glutamine amidotransferase domain-containing protein [Planomonospora venezuelensis]MBB5963996.1 putative intracellular protease/amidase [Planomonospora venezuelensis]GIN05068.1 dihydroxyacetone kinase [Planomonospora venezuelensis]
MTKRILTVLTSHDRLGETGRTTGFYVSEAAHPWEVFHAAGFEMDLASVAGGRPPQDGYDPEDPVQAKFLQEYGERLRSTPRVADVDPARYDAVFFAGGHGTMWDFPGGEGIAELARSVYENGGVVAAVCHGPSALVNVTLSDGSHLVAGKRVAAFTDSEEAAVGLAGEVPFLLASTLAERGALHSGAPDFTEHVVRDGRLVTGQNPASAATAAKEVVAALS